MSNRSALIGAIVFAWLPEKGASSQPGPKYRPVYILDVCDGRAKVAYGTSKRTTEIHRGEFVVKTDEHAGLAKDTKFSLVNQCWLPLDERYFTRNGKLNSLGRLVPEIAQRVVLALTEIGEID